MGRRDADVPGDGDWGGEARQGEGMGAQPLLDSENSLCRANAAGFYRGGQLLFLHVLKNWQM